MIKSLILALFFVIVSITPLAAQQTFSSVTSYENWTISKANQRLAAQTNYSCFATYESPSSDFMFSIEFNPSDPSYVMMISGSIFNIPALGSERQVMTTIEIGGERGDLVATRTPNNTFYFLVDNQAPFYDLLKIGTPFRISMAGYMFELSMLDITQALEILETCYQTLNADSSSDEDRSIHNLGDYAYITDLNRFENYGPLQLKRITNRELAFVDFLDMYLFNNEAEILPYNYGIRIQDENIFVEIMYYQSLVPVELEPDPMLEAIQSVTKHPSCGIVGADLMMLTETRMVIRNNHSCYDDSAEPFVMVMYLTFDTQTNILTELTISSHIGNEESRALINDLLVKLNRIVL